MKKVVNVEEVDGEGLDALIGENVVLVCCRYIYAGELTGVNDTCVLLKNAVLVYETGNWVGSSWKDAQPLANEEFYVSTAAIESFGLSGR